MKVQSVFSLLLLLALTVTPACTVPTPTGTQVVTPVASPTATAPAATATPEPTATATATAMPTATAAITLQPFTNEAMAITGLAPTGWSEIAPGVYNRGQGPTDLARIIQQAAPGATADQITAALLPQLGVQSLPEKSSSYESPALTWDLYYLEVEAPGVGTVAVDVALAKTDAAAYIVLLQALPAEYRALHEAVFLPALEALAPLSAEGEAAATYEDPSGLFSVPIPTNWTAESGNGYGILKSPDGDLTFYVMAVEAESVAEGVKAAWAVIDPSFDLEPEEITQQPTTKGEEEAVSISYDTGDEEKIVAAGGWLYKGIAYIEIIRSDLATLQRRAAQVQIINSGFNIYALEKADLAGVEPLPLSDEIIAQLEDYIVEMMDYLRVPGVAVAIVRDGEIVYSKGFGVRALGSDEPVTPKTLMMIGSTTKSLTTMMMATLVDDGIMDWDTRVVDILPSFRVADADVTERITMRNLVCACSGVPRRDAELSFNASETSAEGIIESLADFEFFTDFGEAFQYSNQMVAAAGYIATLAAGAQYGDLYGAYIKLMQERILDPIGMASSTFVMEKVQASADYAMPHSINLQRETVPIPFETEAILKPIAPAGALWSSVLDMGRYLITELSRGVAPDGTRVVSAENLEVTWEPQIAISADADYGLGWIIEDYKGLRVINHGGNTFGFTSELAFLPDHNLGISVLSNQYGSLINQAIRYRLLELLFQRGPEFDKQVRFVIEQLDKSLAELRGKLLDSVDVEVIQPYLGTYSNDALGELTLSLEDGALMADGGEFKVELKPRLDDKGEIASYFSITPGLGLDVKFAKNDAGEPILVFGGGATEYRFEKVQ
ncbi:MAG: serine hydrolase domain-containing protein [Anaerolineae bacterium]